jgi:hypothetical protein
MNEQSILNYMRQRQGLAMYSDIMIHFCDNGHDLATFKWFWECLLWNRQIGHLTFRGAWHIPFGEPVYTLDRQPYGGWACEYVNRDRLTTYNPLAKRGRR